MCNDLPGETMRCPHILLLPLLMACETEDGEDMVPDSPPEPGWATTCLEGDVDQFDTGNFDTYAFDFSGTVVSDGPGNDIDSPLECYRDMARILEVDDGEGTVWRLGYAVQDADGQDTTPEMDLAPGATVSVSFRSVQQFGAANGFVVQDESGLVAALESGTWGPALVPEDLEDLVVSSGEGVGTVEDQCGTLLRSEILFEGDDATSLTPYSTGPVTVAGNELQAMAVINESWQGDVLCTDLAGNLSWAVFR